MLSVEKQLEIIKCQTFRISAMGFVLVTDTHIFPHTDGNFGMSTDFSNKQCTSFLERLRMKLLMQHSSGLSHKQHKGTSLRQITHTIQSEISVFLCYFGYIFSLVVNLWLTQT